MIFKTATSIQRRLDKSRRDDTLLTAGFNLRTKDTAHTHTSPAWDDTYIVFANNKVPSHAGLGRHCVFTFRRLKPTVNKVSSLRDIST